MHGRAPARTLLAAVLSSLPVVLGVVLEGWQAIAAAVAVVVVVIIAWKFLKFAFRIALIIAAAVAIYFLLKWANVL